MNKMVYCFFGDCLFLNGVFFGYTSSSSLSVVSVAEIDVLVLLVLLLLLLLLLFAFTRFTRLDDVPFWLEYTQSVSS